ncbi:phenylacetate-CoA oxygenase subunit PaaC [Dactylosporangium sp. NBC_01737]|uniref:1,2-phenylacetyl-CoA epoxidase subunit PaaC n=1 Tax=Dactylosporangium sp. NBC_01737 TaxID=2975959 RepID=UPI002E0F40C3|nr:phenylacetate-CoA oxygenase subunit PaaC [Dactylosporangium sp. NBC_01737]
MSHAGYILGLADDALITAQRLGEWCSRAPEMEEDIALANIALDQLGVARMLLTYAGELEGKGRTEDDLAYLRSEHEFRNVRLVELDNGDFAVTMAKLLFLSVYQRLLYDRSIGVGDERLAAVAAKARKESAYHVDHSSRWVVRLGDGTEESHRRMQAAIDLVWPYAGQLFDHDQDVRALDVAGVVVDPATLRPAWLEAVDAVLTEATLTRPAFIEEAGGGRSVHTEALAKLLADMQVLHRAHPGARW